MRHIPQNPIQFVQCNAAWLLYINGVAGFPSHWFPTQPNMTASLNSYCTSKRGQEQKDPRPLLPATSIINRFDFRWRGIVFAFWSFFSDQLAHGLKDKTTIIATQRSIRPPLCDGSPEKAAQESRLQLKNLREADTTGDIIQHCSTHLLSLREIGIETKRNKHWSSFPHPSQISNLFRNKRSIFKSGDTDVGDCVQTRYNLTSRPIILNLLATSCRTELGSTRYESKKSFAQASLRGESNYNARSY